MSLEFVTVKGGIQVVKCFFAFANYMETKRLTCEIQRQNEMLMHFNQLIEKKLRFDIYRYEQSKMNQVKASQQHMKDAVLSTSDEVRNNALCSANAIFTQLINMPEYECIPSGDVNCPDQRYCNRPFISWGYWGRFEYFGIIGDYKNALLQVYECAVVCPAVATDIFDKAFFPRFDVSEFFELCRDYDLLKADKGLSVQSSYSGIPASMAIPLLEMQIDEFKNRCSVTLEGIKGGKSND